MLREIYGMDVPDRLRDLASRHQRHVAELVHQLRSSGMADALIERSVDRLIASYRSELLVAVKDMGSLLRD